MYPGEYPTLVRSSFWNGPVVASKVTGRLRRQYYTGASGFDGQQHQILCANTGATNFTLQLRQTNSYVSGPWVNVGAATAMTPHGEAVINAEIINKYLEVTSTSGSGELRLQIQSKVRWDVMAFSKTDADDSLSAVTYPDELWARLNNDTDVA
jgi:hypothetical protein